MQRTVFNKTRICWAVEIWGKQVTDKNIKRTCFKWWWMAWLCLSVVLSPRSRDRLLIQMLIGHFAQKFSVHCRHRAFVVILQNLQTILLQVHSIKAPWVTLSKTHYSIPREAMKVCYCHVLLVSSPRAASCQRSAKDHNSWWKANIQLRETVSRTF